MICVAAFLERTIVHLNIQLLGSSLDSSWLAKIAWSGPESRVGNSASSSMPGVVSPFVFGGLIEVSMA